LLLSGAYGKASLKKITNKEYRELTGLSDEGARLDLIELSKRNLIQPIGKGRSAHYILGTFGD